MHMTEVHRGADQPYLKEAISNTLSSHLNDMMKSIKKANRNSMERQQLSFPADKAYMEG